LQDTVRSIIEQIKEIVPECSDLIASMTTTHVSTSSKAEKNSNSAGSSPDVQQHDNPGKVADQFDKSYPESGLNEFKNLIKNVKVDILDAQQNHT